MSTEEYKSRRFWLPILGFIAGLCAIPITLFVIFITADAGHGNQMPVSLFFPCSMFLESSELVLVVSALQFPLYGVFSGFMLARRRWFVAWLPVVIHLAAFTLGLALGLAEY
ncbi:MAG: hypothetical protein WBH85_19910 [Thermoanaerobaculia bacterium]